MTQLAARGYRLDGVDDALYLGSAPAIDAPYTVEFAALVEAMLAGNPTFLTTRPNNNAGGGDSAGMDIQMTPNGGLHGDIGNGVGYLTTSADTAGAVLEPRKWAQVAYVITQSSWSIFVDSVQKATGALGAGAKFAGAGGHLFVGGLLVAGPVRGCIRDVRLWNRALTVAELSAARPRLRGDEAGLVGWWPLDAGHDVLDRVIRLTPRPARDDFAVDGPVNGRVAPSGHVWTATAGMITDDGLLVPGAQNRSMTLDVGTPDVDVQALFVFPAGNADTMLLARYVDANNHLRALVSRNVSITGVTLQKVVAGIVTSLVQINTAWVPGSTHLVRLRADAETVTIYADGVLLPGSTSYYEVDLRGTAVGLTSTGHVAADAGTAWGAFSATPIRGRALHGSPKNGARPALLRVAA